MVTGKLGPQRAVRDGVETWQALGGQFFPQPDPSCGQVLPEQKIRHSGATKNAKSIGLLTRLVECLRARQCCAELILWSSRTGD